jgi:hypothetical protein
MILLILIFIIYTIIWALPLYFCINLVLWLFHITFRITLLQAIGLGMLLGVIQSYFYEHKEDK